MLTSKNINTQGRLGNGMFCIASTIGLSILHKVDYVLPPWKYQQFFTHPLNEGIIQCHRTIKEGPFHYSEYPELAQAKHLNFNLSGYFQSYKYWQHCEEVIYKVFDFKQDLREKVLALYPLRENETCISVRRGDYVGNVNYINLGMDYYNSGIDRIGDTNYLVFSDDIAWCKEAFKMPNVRFIEGLSDIESLCRMSMCKNFITANSTYSWFGAYLSQTDGVIIRPEKYYKGPLCSGAT